MARRRGPPPEKSALGSVHKAAALTRLDKLRDLKIAAMVPFDVTVSDIMEMYFDPRQRDILRAARGLVSVYDAVSPFPVVEGVKLRPQEFGVLASLGYATPITEGISLFMDHPKTVPFVRSVVEAKAIIEDFAVARGTLLWMDKHMGTGTLRYYLPAIMQLVPSLDQGLIERVVQPPGLSALLPAIRETSSLVAAAALLPEKPNDSAAFTLQFGSYNFQRNGIDYNTDPAFIKI